MQEGGKRKRKGGRDCCEGGRDGFGETKLERCVRVGAASAGARPGTLGRERHSQRPSWGARAHNAPQSSAL